MVSALSEDTSAGVLPFEGPEERRLPAGNLESSSPAMIDVVSKSSDFQGPTYNTQASEERADENDAEILNCDRWLISVSSAVPEGKMISAQKDAGDGVDSKGHFVIYVSEPNRERTLVRTAEDFYRLHSDLTESRALVQDLPFGVGRHRDSINMNQGVASKQSQLATPSHKPKKRGSSFFAKVRSVFRDLDQVKPPPVQSKDLERVHVPTTDPPISPPHSPTARSHVEIGLFEFEKGKPLKPDHTHVVGERTTGYPSLTPSSSSVDNAKNDRTKQLGNSATEPIAHRIRSSSSSTLGESAHSSPKTSDQRKSEPSSDDILQPSLLSTSPLDALNFRSLKLSSSSSDSDREGVHIALTNYLSDLCKDGTLSSSLALRNFFITRPSDLEHQSNKQRNLACRQTGIIASENELDEDSPPTGFDVKISMIENSLPRRIRNAENGISGIDLPENAETSTESHIRSGVNRQVSADAHVSDYGFVRGIITRASSCGQRHGSINELGFSTLPSVVSNGFANQLPTQIDTTEISATSTQKDGANGCIDVPPKPTARRPLTVDDFDLIHTLGKGCAGKVVLVRHKHNQKVYAMKAMVKKHVIAHSELQHTLIEQAVLKRMSTEDEQLRNPFIVKLWWSFHDEYNLYLVLDFHPGGDLATQLSRWGRLGRDRARFYTAEIVEGVEGLHAAGVIYRDLKPENVLLGQDGHIVLVDFGLAADFFPNHRSPGTMLPHWMATGAEQAAEDGRPMMHRHATGVARAKERDLARSFVGTAEYLAPEVIRGLPYSYEVDWWSLGTMLYEALIGNTPFWAENHAEMYVSILNNELIFPEDNALDRDTRSFIRGLLCKDPSMRLTEPRIKRHPYLSMVDFDHVRSRRYIPPYIPPTDSSLEFDTSNFDKTFLVMDTNLKRESVNTAENADHPDKRGTPAVDETAFTAYNFGESEMSRAISKESDTEKSETSSGTGENVVRSDKCQRKSDDESDLASGSDSASVSVSDFGSEDGLGVAATEEALAEVDDNDSTIGNIENGKQETSSGRASEEMSPAVLERIKTLASEPGVKASARHSRDLSRVSVDLDHRHHLEAGDRRSADEWTILEAEPDEQATNGRKVSDTLFAKGVVDKYRLALRKRRGTSKLSRQPSWRSPSSSLVLGRAGNGNNVRDTEKTTGRFMTPLSPTLAGIKSKFKNRSRSKQRFRAEPTSPKAGVLLGRNLHLVSNESTTRETGGTRSAPYPTFLGPLSRGGSDGVVETPVPLSPADDALRVELEQTSKTDMSNKADATHLKAATKCG